MSLRAFVFGLLTTDAELNELGLNADSTFITHDVDTPQVRPLMVLRWQRTDPGMGDEETDWVNFRRLQVWIHDEPGDYDRIDRALRRVRSVLMNVRGTYTGTTRHWVTQTNWEGDSDDLRDDDAGTIARHAQFLFVGSAA